MVEAYGVDPLRYFFMREVSFGQDGNYSHEAIVARINADLSNDLGNLAQRSMTMVGKQFGGKMPQPGAFTANDQAILAAADGMIGKARDAMKTQQLHQVLNAVWAVVADANRYFAGEAPWALAKTDPARQGTVLYVTAEVIRQVAILALPFMPTSAAKLLDLLNIPQSERDFAGSAAAIGWRPARRSARSSRCSRATSSRKPRRAESHARRQPLPSRFSGLRGRARRRGGARRSRRRRPHGHDLDARAPPRAAARPSRSGFRSDVLGRHASASRA